MSQRVQLLLTQNSQHTSRPISTESERGENKIEIQIPFVKAESESSATMESLSPTQIMPRAKKDRKLIQKISSTKLGQIYVTKGAKAMRPDSSQQNIRSINSLLDVQQSHQLSRFRFQQLDLSVILPHLDQRLPNKKIVSKNHNQIRKLPSIIQREKFHSTPKDDPFLIKSPVQISFFQNKKQLIEPLKSQYQTSKGLRASNTSKNQGQNLTNSQNQLVDLQSLDFQTQIRQSKINQNPSSRAQLQPVQIQETQQQSNTPLEELDQLKFVRNLKSFDGLQKQSAKFSDWQQKSSAKYYPKAYKRIDLQKHHQLVPLSSQRAQPLFENVTLNQNQKQTVKSKDDFSQRFNEIKIVRKPRQPQAEHDTLFQQIKELKIQRLR